MSKSAKKHASPKPSKKAKSKPSPSVATKAARSGTKSFIILQLLGRASGATVKELAAAANWQEHSVRGFLSGTLKKKLGIDVTSQITDGVRHYKIAETDARR